MIYCSNHGSCGLLTGIKTLGETRNSPLLSHFPGFKELILTVVLNWRKRRVKDSV